ncbi:MAG: RNA polymerase sigma factor [Aeromonas veronii]
MRASKPSPPASRLPDDLGAERAYLVRFAHSLTRNQTDAEDLVQDAWAAYLAGYDPAEVRSRRSLLSTIIFSLFINGRRRAACRIRAARLLAPLVDESLDLGRALDIERVLAVMDQLAPHYRDVCALYYVEGYGHEEVARHLAVGLGTVKSRLSRSVEQATRLINTAPLSQGAI